MNKFKNGISFAITLSLLAGLTSCNRPLTTNQITPANAFVSSKSITQSKKIIPTNPNSKWTLAIYMAGDNDLYYSALDDINEMEAGLSAEAEKYVNIIIMFDGKEEGDSKIYKIVHDKTGYDDKIISEVIDDKGLVIPENKEVNTGNPEVFNKFVDFVTTNYPAQRNVMSVWNHGGGIYRAKYLTNSLIIKTSMFADGGAFGTNLNFKTQNFASDYTSGGELFLRHLDPALEIAKKNLGKKLDIFGFDACLMGTLETAYQAADYADVFIASEETEPGDGWDYVAYLTELSKNLNITPKNLAASIVKNYALAYQPNGSQGINPNIVLSATDLNKLKNNLIPSLNIFAKELEDSLPANKATILKVREKTASFTNYDSSDFGHFLNLYLKEFDSLAGKNLLATYKDTIIKSSYYGTPVKNATGLVIYFPIANYNARYDNANDIRFTETKNWTSFIKKFAKQ